jgi:ribonuclease HI
VVAAKSFTRKGLLEPVAAEDLAAIMAIQLFRELGFQRLYLEGDAKIVVDTVLSTEPDWSRKGHLVEDIRVELQSLQCWKMVYVRREDRLWIGLTC